MKYFLRSGLLCLFSFSMIASSQGTEVPWELSWPFFENTSDPSGVLNGYGDWCVIEEGPHPGLDFAAVDTIVKVLVPTGSDMVSLGARDYQYNDEGCSMVIGPFIVGDPPYWGWGLLHLNIRNPGEEPFVHGSSLSGWQPLAPCYKYEWSTGNPAPVHMHLGWIDCIQVSYPPYVVPNVGPFEGYYNPFEYFEDDLSSYDEIQFKKVHFEGFNNTGAWFMPDGTETAKQISALTNYQVFQDFVSGAIDVAVSPFSAFQGLSNRDSSGVYSIWYEILRQDPFTLAYLPAAPDTGNFGKRFLIEMRDEELPYGDSDEFRAIFLDGHLTDGTNPSPPAFCLGENAYIITNSGALDTLSWQTGWDNVYTDQGYENDWETGICQGAWDTFLAEPEITGKPSSNREAFFPDGRYAVEVTAVSHASSLEGSLRLPVDDLGSADPDTAGIIVDNFLPGGGTMIVYTSEYVGDSLCIDVKYIGIWEDDGKNDSGYLERMEYLEELREDLRFFQKLEQTEEVDEIPLPPSLQMCEERFNSFPARFHEESFVNSGLDMRNAVPIDDIRYSNREFGNTDYGFSLSGEVGQDPVEFLLEEIARVEGEMDYRGGNRNFHKSVHGYIPVGRNNETLNMLVIYSEPTMVENSSGSELTDVIWMSGRIVDIEYWDSREHGTFVRDTPSGNAEQVDILQNALGMYFPEEPDASYAVHYTFDGNLPSEYSGIIQIHIGTMYPADNDGPRDLAGHLMDGHPITVPATRRGYESWNWDRMENDHSFYPQGYEPGPDLSYHWGRPWWDRYVDIAIGHVVDEIVAEVNLASIGLEEADLIESCFYWCGFWMYHDEPGYTDFHIPIVKPDGSILHHTFYTTYPVYDHEGGGLEEPFWFGGPSFNSFSSDAQYFWMTGSECNVDNNHSEALAYCVDSETCSKRYRLCVGWCTGTDQTDLPFDCCMANIEKVYNSGAALVRYYKCYGPEQYTEHCRILQPPCDKMISTFEEPSSSRQSTADAVIDDESLMVLSNPTCETLDIMVSGESGESWNLDLYDISGRCVVSETGVLRNGGSVLNIGVESLPSGVYMLKTEVGGNEEVRSISIVH